ncbi:hypothetical protein EP7_005291 [Isosphaeraceae bacterium EP7]
MVEEADRRLQALPAEYRDLAPRVLLRLVRMSPDSDTFHLAAATRSDLRAEGPATRVDAVIEALADAKAIRVTPAADPTADVVELRYEALTRVWGLLRSEMEERRKFRDAVRFWDRAGQDPVALVTGSLLNRIVGYHDLNYLEKKFVSGSREREVRGVRLSRLLAVSFAILAAVAIFFAVRARSEAKSRVALAANFAFRERLEAKRRVALAEKNVELAKDKANALEGEKMALAEKVKAEVARGKALENERVVLKREKGLIEKVASQEREKQEAIKLDATVTSTSTLATAMLLMREEQYQTHAAKKLLIIQTLGQVLFAGDKEAANAAAKNWKRLEEQLVEHDPNDDHKLWFGDFLRSKFKDEIKRITSGHPPDRARIEDLKKISSALSPYIANIKTTQALAIIRPVLLEESIGLAERLTGAATAGEPLSDVEIFRLAFWRLRAGGLVIVAKDDRDFENAVEAFAVALRHWEDADAVAPREIVQELSKGLEQLRAVKLRVPLTQTAVRVPSRSHR